MLYRSYKYKEHKLSHSQWTEYYVDQKYWRYRDHIVYST